MMMEGGRMEVDREDKGIDLEHFYACGDELKHPKDGAFITLAIA